MTNTAIGQLLYSLNYKDPFDAANKYLGQIQGTISPYYNPYIKTGKYALGKTTGAYNKYMTNPADVINQLGQGYTASPGYQYNVDQATNAANQAGAAGGMVGTPQLDYPAKITISICSKFLVLASLERRECKELAIRVIKHLAKWLKI